MAKTPPPTSENPYFAAAPDLRRFLLFGVLPALLLLTGCYIWFVQRVEVGLGEVLVLVRKVGEPLPAAAGNDVVLYPALLASLGEPEDSTRYQGIIYKTLGEGRYFFDPFFWERHVVPAVLIEQGEIGVKIRKYGKPLPPGKIVATEPDERGPLEQVMPPGRENINPFAYDVKRFKAVFIAEGQVGVQTRLSGRPPGNPNQYVVVPGERGVQPDVLPPGMSYINPYVMRVDAVDVRSHTIDLAGDEAIHFPSNDSFDILVEGTVEYAIRQDKAPYVMVAIGDHEDIKEKLILPYAKSFSRIEGSKLLAREFISGEMREEFQRRVFNGLRDECYAQGIELRAVLIRRIDPPAEIAGPISDRQVADQQIRQFESEMKLADAQARLVEQEEMQKQNQELGQANREVVTTVLQAEQSMSVSLTEANKRLEVAKLELQAASEMAAARLARGEADAQVIRLGYEARTGPLAQAIEAFGGGALYAQNEFYLRLAPALKSVLATTDGPFADIFRGLAGAAPTPRLRTPTQPETAQGAAP